MEITIPMALIAGIISFASPCFLPVVPAFVGQLVGDRQVGTDRRYAAGNALAFVGGFSAVFIALWASIGLLSQWLVGIADVLRVGGGIILIVMGLHLAGLIEISMLNRVVRLPFKAHTREHSTGLGRSALLGVVFGAGWTPCIGPVLGGILAMASTASAGQGLALMIVYCLGLGLPLVAVTLGFTELGGRFGWFKRHHGAIAVVSGAILIAIGFLLVTDMFVKLAAFVPAFGV